MIYNKDLTNFILLNINTDIIKKDKKVYISNIVVKNINLKIKTTLYDSFLNIFIADTKANFIFDKIIFVLNSFSKSFKFS